MANVNTTELELWEKELLAGHRWGRMAIWFDINDDRGVNEHTRLKELWQAAQPISESSTKIIEQIIGLEICNWRLEDSILALCQAIGTKKPVDTGIGHMASMTDERWKKIWAYYLTLGNWLPCSIPAGYATLLKEYDPYKTIQNHIEQMLGKRDKLKELYVCRFRLCLEFWLTGYPPSKSHQIKAHRAAVSALETEIKKLDPERKVLNDLILKSEGEGRLNPCNHKTFYRYDLIISSIGAKKWRGSMGRRLTDGFKRFDLLEKYLTPIESWIHGGNIGKIPKDRGLFEKIADLLGNQDSIKLYLASLLVSLLRSQQLAAQKLAEQREKDTTE